MIPRTSARRLPTFISLMHQISWEGDKNPFFSGPILGIQSFLFKTSVPQETRTKVSPAAWIAVSGRTGLRSHKNRRSQALSILFSRRQSRGPPPPPLYFYTKLGPEGLQNIFWRPPAPRPLPPYSKVWIRHCTGTNVETCKPHMRSLTKPGGTSVPPISVTFEEMVLLEEVTERLGTSVILFCKEK